MEKYDSAQDTLNHIAMVKLFVGEIIKELIIRIENHDKSKLESPEKEYFDKFTPMLSSITYGSQEYQDMLKRMEPAIKHHHASIIMRIIGTIQNILTISSAMDVLKILTRCRMYAMFADIHSLQNEEQEYMAWI